MMKSLSTMARKSPFTTAFLTLIALTFVCMVVLGIPWTLH